MAHDFLFDIGNVILKFDFAPAIERLAARSKVAAPDIFDRITPVKEALESGEVGDDLFIEEAMRLLRFSGERDDFVRIWCEIFEINEPMADFIDQLAASGHRLLLLSNTSGLHMDYIFQTFPVFRHFEGGVHYAAKCAKPEPEIYTQTIERFDLTPSNTLYVDDLLINIQAGEHAGLRAIHYHHEAHDRFAVEIEAAGVDLSASGPAD